MYNVTRIRRTLLVHRWDVYSKAQVATGYKTLRLGSGWSWTQRGAERAAAARIASRTGYDSPWDVL